jgi:hypothetical protein
MEAPQVSPAASRDVLSPREVASRAGFSYHAILRAIRRGDLEAFEPVPGHYRVSLAEYERWLRTPARRAGESIATDSRRTHRRRVQIDDSGAGSVVRLQAIEREA